MKYHHSKMSKDIINATAAQSITSRPSVQRRSFFRSTLSATIPPNSGMNSIGQDNADTAMPILRGDPVASNTHMALANTLIVRPELEVIRPMKSRR